MTNKITLLEAAKALRVNVDIDEFSSQELELALGWAKGDVGLMQVTGVMKHKNTANTYVFLSRALRCIILNQIKSKETNNE